MKQTRNYLKTLFQAGKRPKESDYADLLDSYVHKDEQQAANSQAFNQRLNQYDNYLKQASSGNFIATLGDVLTFLNNLGKTPNLATRLAGLGSNAAVAWNAITSKPASVPLRWSEQILVITPENFGSYNGDGNISMPKWLVSEVAGAGTVSANLLIDLQMQSRILGTVGGTATGTVIYAHTAVRVKIAVNPYVNLSL